MKSKQFKNKEPIEETKNRRCAKCGKYHTQVTNNQKLSSHTLADKIYLGISISIFLLISIILGYTLLVEYLTGFKNMITMTFFFSFFVFIFFCFYIILPRFFNKRCIINLTSSASLLIVVLSIVWFYYLLWENGAIRPKSSPITIIFYDIVHKFEPLYTILLAITTSLISIIFFFMNDNRFKQNCISKNANKWFVFIIIFIMLIPNFIHILID